MYADICIHTHKCVHWHARLHSDMQTGMWLSAQWGNVFDGRVLGKNAHLFWMYIQVHALYKNCIWIWILIPNGPHLIVGGEGGGGSVSVFQTEPNKIKQSWSLKTGCLWPEIHLHLQKNVSHSDLKFAKVLNEGWSPIVVVFHLGYQCLHLLSTAAKQIVCGYSH